MGVQCTSFRVTCGFFINKTFKLGIINTPNRGKDTFSVTLCEFFFCS
jgi:hypothetical protein